jgi:hypothetical protein
MDVLAVILACSLHPDDGLVRGLVRIQSGGDMYFVGDLATLKVKDGLHNAAEALKAADGIRTNGGRPAVGLLGIPLAWASRYGRAEGDLFDACTNVAIGTAVLAEHRDRCGGRSPRLHTHSYRRRVRSSWHRPDSAALRTCTLSRFAADLGVSGSPAAVLESIAPRRASAADNSSGSPPERSAIFVDDSGEDTSPTTVDGIAARKGVAATAMENRDGRSRSAPPTSSSLGPSRTTTANGTGIRIVPGKLPSAATAAARPPALTHLPR